jgi:putative addiction module component (TIGR02574 family)
LEKRTKKILDEALALPEPERAELVEILATTLEEDIFSRELHPDWIPEIERRLQEIRDGTAELIPWEEVKERVHREVFGD